MAENESNGKETNFDEQVKHFEEEAEKFGERVEKKFEEKGKEWKCCFTKSFGIMGPLFLGLLSFVCFLIGLWVVGWLNNSFFSIELLTGIVDFFNSYLGVFFVLFLISSYGDYFMKEKKLWLVSPWFISVRIVSALWVIANILLMMNVMELPVIPFFTIFELPENLIYSFIFFLFLGYLILVLKKFVIGGIECQKK